MKKFDPFFPLNAGVTHRDLKSLLMPLVIYLVACAVLNVLRVILGWIPLVGWLLELVFSLLGIYCVAGIILSIIKYVDTNA